MKRFLIFLLLLPSALANWTPGQLARTARIAPPSSGPAYYYPTNLPAQPAYVWYVWEDYTTNSGMGTLPERLLALDATNTAGTLTPNEGPSLNGKRTGYFDGSTEFLLCQPFATGGQPYSFHFVCALTNAAGAAAGMASSTNSSGNNYVGYVGSSARAQVRAGTTVNPGYFETNRWMSISVVFNGASSQIWTNGVQLGSNFNPSTGQWIGLEIGRLGLSSGFDGRWTLAEMTCFTNQALTQNNISNLFSYATNVYGFGY